VSAAKVPVSDAEREVLKVLWDAGPSAVRQIRARLEQRGRRWAHTTVNTLLGRMEQKGYVTRDANSFAHVFAAAVSREEMVQERLMDLAEAYCDGTPLPLMLAFVESQRFTKQDIEAFRRLLDRLESDARRKKAPTRKRR
jgi:predicted transcriptional regulator